VGSSDFVDDIAHLDLLSAESQSPLCSTPWKWRIPTLPPHCTQARRHTQLNSHTTHLFHLMDCSSQQIPLQGSLSSFHNRSRIPPTKRSQRLLQMAHDSIPIHRFVLLRLLSILSLLLPLLHSIPIFSSNLQARVSRLHPLQSFLQCQYPALLIRSCLGP